MLPEAAEQPQRARPAVHAAGGGAAAAVPHLPARARHLARLHRRQDRPGGQWIGLENYEFLWGDSVTRLALFNTLFYTVVASVIKFVLGLWLALLLNRNIRFKSFFRAVILLPYIVPTALSAIAFWWIYDAQFSIISWALVKLGLIDRYIDFLGDPWNARSRSSRQRLARRALRRDHAAGRACRPSRRRSTRPRPSTAPRRGSSSATSRCRCSRRSSRW
jgi:hypothetical protein